MHEAGHYYHVYNRGCNRQPIFLGTDNYRFLLRRAQSFLATRPVTVIAYCLMPNHYHLLVRVERDGALSPFLQRLFISYTQAFNRQHRRTGTLFEGRAKTILVDTDEYVLRLSRYIHLNPVKAGLAQHPAQWPFSNYLEWVGQRSGSLVDPAFIHQYFASPAEYQSFVLEELDSAAEEGLAPYCLD